MLLFPQSNKMDFVMSGPSNLIVYFEQPLNDPMRICLRLEQLFINLEENLKKSGEIHSQAALTALVRMMDVIDRPDFKSKLMQTLTQMTATLNKLRSSPEVDPKKLAQMLQDLDAHITFLLHSKIAEKCRHNDFLKHLRLQFNNPGGPCSYKSPSYQLWLGLPAEQRLSDLMTWREEYVALENLVTMILKITRESAKMQAIICENGFHHQTLDPNLPCEIVRVGIPAKYVIYPEISAGKHRLSIRLLHPDFQDTGRAVQTTETVSIELYCCRS